MNYNAKSYQAASMGEALARIKQELGPDAVILESRTIQTPQGKRVEVRAGNAPPRRTRPAPVAPGASASSAQPRVSPASSRSREDAPRLRDVLSDADLEAAQLQRRLVQHEVAEELARRLAQQVQAAGAPLSQAALQDRLRELIAACVPPATGIELPHGAQRRVAVVGGPGSGKTTTVAKLAAHFRLREGRAVALLSLDHQRLAAHEQLRRFGELIGVPVFAAQSVAEVRSLPQQAAQADLLLIDTPGISPADAGRFARVAALLRAARPEETHLVLPASASSGVQRRYADLLSKIGVSHVLLTRLDEVVGLGVILNVVDQINLPLSYLSSGQNIPHDLRTACGHWLAEILCQPVEQIEAQA